MKGFVTRFVADPKPRARALPRARCRSSTTSGSRREIDANLGRKVWLKSGGYLIVDQSEALTAIDVNTGPLRRQARSRGDGAQDQSRGRAGGRAPAPLPQHRRAHHHRPDRHGEQPRTARRSTGRSRRRCAATRRKTNILKISELGSGRDDAQAHAREPGAAAVRAVHATARARGYVLSRESVAHKVLREIRKDLPRFGGPPDRDRGEPARGRGAARARAQGARRARAESSAARSRCARVPGMHQEQFEVTALDDGTARVDPARLARSRRAGPGGRAARAWSKRPPIPEPMPTASRDETRSPKRTPAGRGAARAAAASAGGLRAARAGARTAERDDRRTG